MNIQDEIMSEMKQMLREKTECMISSYGEVLSKTKIMMYENLNEDIIDSEEIAKRADMFWNIALQKIEREHGEAFSRRQDPRFQAGATIVNGGNGNNEVVIHEGEVNLPNETPCAKRARESADKIARLQAEVEAGKEIK